MLFVNKLNHQLLWWFNFYMCDSIKFSKLFSKREKISPSEFREKNQKKKDMDTSYDMAEFNRRAESLPVYKKGV